MPNKRVAILMGSDSDVEVMKDAFSILKRFNVGFEAHVMSAHRTPHEVMAYVKESETRGIKVFIAGAGCAAHLAGVIASHTVMPVIGVPLDASSLKGIDALLATVQMPAGIPVATVAIGKAGAYNAGLLAVQCLAIADTALVEQLREFRKDMIKKVQDKDKKLQDLITEL